MIDGRAKGAAGEREFCKWLQTKFGLDELPTRNLEQTREGGADILGFKPFIFEVKRVEVLSLRHWWRQAVLAAKMGVGGEIPVVAFRQNRQPWRFLISASYLNPRIETGYIQVEEREFLMWVELWRERNVLKEDKRISAVNFQDIYDIPPNREKP